MATYTTDRRSEVAGSVVRSYSVARVGLLLGAATAGVLIGFGLRHGTALQPFTGAGRIMLDAAATRVPDIMLAFFGAAAHFAIAAAIAWLTVMLARGFPRRAVIIALAMAVSVWMATEWLFPSSLRALTADLSRPQQLIYFTVLGVTLWGGIRFAPTVVGAGFSEP